MDGGLTPAVPFPVCERRLTMGHRVSNLTDAERERRRVLDAMVTPQSLAGLLYVAEQMAEGKTFDWTDGQGRTLPISERHDIIKEAILDMQRREDNDEHLE